MELQSFRACPSELHSIQDRLQRNPHKADLAQQEKSLLEEEALQLGGLHQEFSEIIPKKLVTHQGNQLL